MTRRSLNREMKKLGFLPESGPHLRPIKPMARVYTNGRTRIGIAQCDDDAFVSKRRQNLMPVVNRTMYANSARRGPGYTKMIAERLVEQAQPTLI